jgi:flagellar hook assembly protein FlgD
VVLDVYSMQGEKIATCASGRYAPGVYRIRWNGKRDDGSAIPSGIYMVRMAAGNFRAVKTMLHLK